MAKSQKWQHVVLGWWSVGRVGMCQQGLIKTDHRSKVPLDGWPTAGTAPN